MKLLQSKLRTYSNIDLQRPKQRESANGERREALLERLLGAFKVRNSSGDQLVGFACVLKKQAMLGDFNCDPKMEGRRHESKAATLL